jgi:light-regulated signal transduction histidine kinase (bacteriophytochrome)
MSLRGYRIANEELRSLNDTLREQKRALEVVNRELESFSYSVSHDLRGPLRAIDGFSHAVLQSCGERLDPEAQRHLGRIRDAASRMSQLIDDMLALAQVTRREMRREDVDFSGIARTIGERLQATAPQRKVEFAIASDVRAHGDARLLAVLLENLLGNAWKFTGKQPQARIEFGAQAQGGKTVYHVRDNGAGFDMTYAGKLFMPFSRLHSAQEYEGTGVGLAIVQRVVQRHGGEISAEGQVGAGASFRFTLDGEGAR